MFDYEKSFTRTDEYGQTYVDFLPARYNNIISTSKPTINGSWVNYGEMSSKESLEKCAIETTSGEILNSGSFIGNSVSCESHVYNAGNYYNLPSQLGNAKYNSVCPKGWRLPENNGDTSYSNLLLAYGIDFDAGDNRISPYDAALLNLPLSYLRSGYYYDTGALNYQGSNGYYRMSSLRLGFNSSNLNPTYSTNADVGYSVRCVSR